MTGAPPLPSGAELLQEIERAAEARSIPLGEFIIPIAKQPRSFLHNLRHARRPRPETVERVRALIGGLPIPGALEATIQFAGGTPGSVNTVTSAYALQRTLEAKARLEIRRHLADQARVHRLPGETLAAAVRRLEQRTAA